MIHLNVPIVVVFMANLIAYTSLTVYMVWKYGWNPSISETWYEQDPSNKVLFGMFLLAIGYPTLLLSSVSPFFIVSSLGFTLVAISPDYKASWYTKSTHYLGAVMGISMFHIGLISQGYLYPLVLNAILIIASQMIHKQTRITFIELLSAFCLLVGEFHLMWNMIHGKSQTI